MTTSAPTEPPLTLALVRGPRWDDPLTALCAARATHPFKEKFSGARIVFSTGREHDASTGLYYYRARYYHPGLQRFISEDPLGLLAGDPNFYAYVGDNPLRFRDPFGLDREDPFMVDEPGLGSPFIDPIDLIGGLGGISRVIISKIAARKAAQQAARLADDVGRAAADFTERQLQHFERQLAEHGRRSLERSRTTLERRLKEHLDKLDTIQGQGGPSGSVLREIRNFQRQINAIDKILGGNP